MHHKGLNQPLLHTVRTCCNALLLIFPHFFRILLLTACPSIGYDTNRGADPFRESVDGGITDLI